MPRPSFRLILDDVPYKRWLTWNSLTGMADMTTGKFVAYHRVSTAQQGASGLGLEAQQEAVAQYLNGGDWELVGEFVEVESGKRDRNRPQLHQALDMCRREKATLVIAKLDRLARNVHFISGLLEAGVEFVAVDNPHATKFMVHMLAAFAEHERDQISARTKAALTAAKARGVVLGKNGAVLARQNAAAADNHARRVAADVHRLRRGRSVRQLVDVLNRENVPTANGGPWHASTVHRLLKRLDVLAVAQNEAA